MNHGRFVPIATCLLLTSLASSAQTYIFGRADFGVGSVPTSIATGDFNGDGLIDLAVTNSNDNTVSVLLGKPDGTFAPQVTYATGSEPVAVVTGDFNGDGNLDLAITNGSCTPGKYAPVCSSGTVSILLGNGDGTFRSHIDYPVGTLPSSLVAADFNGDGKLDLAITNAIDSTVSVLLGNGDGTFQTQAVYATAPSLGWQSVVVGDFNGDGKLDLAVSCSSVVSVLLGNGDGTFRTHLDSGAGGVALAAGDFNGDGKLDLVVTSGTGFANNLSNVLIGVGDGTFFLQATYPGGSSVAVADLNGDGKPDLVVSQSGSLTSVSVLLGNGDGTFQTPVEYGTAPMPLGVMLADLNGDGKLDLAVAGSGCELQGPASCSGEQIAPGPISVLLGFGDGTFVGKTDYIVGAGPLSITSADFRNDGKVDLATADQGGNLASVLLGNGDGTFQPATSYSTATSPLWAVTGDFRNNGIVDLVTVNETCVSTPPCNPGTVSVLLGNGDGTFQPHVDYAVGLIPLSAAVGDFRNNGELDLAVANSGSGTISILLGNGDGTFQPQVVYLTAPNPQQIAVGDFNHDGNLDLAVTTVGAPGVSILLGNGDGTFKPHVDYVGGYPAIAVGDFNGDGKLDLATGGEGSVSILLGNGDGTFKSPVSYPTGMMGGAVGGYIVVTDFNQDGKLDLGVSNGSTAILLGNGDGTFQAPVEYRLANIVSESLTVGDFNADGAPDWAATDPDNNTVGVMLSAAFKAISPRSLNFGSQGVGTTSRPQTITLSNASSVNINIASIVPSGDFGQSNNCGSSINLASSCTVNVTFSPTIPGQQSGAITITDNTRISPLAIPISGTGVNGPFLSVYPARQNFSPQTVGSNSTPSAIMLVNTGNAALSISSIGIIGTNSSDFSQTNTCSSSLGVGGSCTVNVTFAPTAAGSRMASLSISDTAPGSPQSGALVGTGLGPLPTLVPNSLTFASQQVGTTSGGQAVTLTNLGSSALSISSISATGDFAQTNTCGTSLAAGSNCQITVTFSPTVAGTRTGTVAINDNAAGSPQTVSLSGVATAAPDFAIGPAPGQPASQTVSAGQSAKFSLMLMPSGSFTGTVNLSCSIKPVVSPAPTCSLPSSVQVSGSSGQSVTVTIGTTAAVTTGTISHVNFPSGWIPMAWAGMLFLFACFWLRARRRLPVLAAPIIVLAVASWVGCGGGGSSSSRTTTPGTPAGAYTVTITATSGNLSHNMTLTVTVQ